MGVVKDAIDRLTRLQALDSQIRKFRTELEEKPRLMGAEKKQLDDARAALVEAERKARDAQKAADRKELDVRTKEDAIKKLDGQLNGATSNKVYSDLLLNIKSQRMDIEKMEEAILGMMDEVEALEADVERVRVVLRNAEDEFKEAEKLAQKQGIRDLLATEVDPAVLATYDRVREARKGIGITAVEVDAEGSHFCSSCQINITLQDISVAMGGEKVVQCKSCNRILYVASMPEKPEGDAEA